MQDINIDSYRFETPISMRWNDLDALGHVNNIYYFEYFQIARGIYMPTASPQWDWYKNMFVIAHMECDYLQELTMQHAEVVAKVKTSLISNKSFQMDYLIVSKEKDGNDIVHAKGQSINVMVDILTKKSTIVPDWLRRDLNTFEPGLNNGI